jgi:hypothetical protein
LHLQPETEIGPRTATGASKTPACGWTATPLDTANAADRLDDARRWCRQHRADWDHDRFDFGVYIRK